LCEQLYSTASGLRHVTAKAPVATPKWPPQGRITRYAICWKPISPCFSTDETPRIARRVFSRMGKILLTPRWLAHQHPPAWYCVAMYAGVPTSISAVLPPSLWPLTAALRCSAAVPFVTSESSSRACMHAHRLCRARRAWYLSGERHSGATFDYCDEP
jgi:hypothetical protein